MTLVPCAYDAACAVSGTPRIATYGIDTLLLLRQSPLAKHPHCGVPVELPQNLQRDVGDPHFWRPRKPARIYGQMQARAKR